MFDITTPEAPKIRNFANLFA